MTLKGEISSSFAVFQNDWQASLSGRIADLANHVTYLESSYTGLTTLQAWRCNVIESQLSAGSGAFYTEAQNDALISHVQASLGSWRVALKALRSCIENVLMCLYYMDHNIELQLWEKGEFKMGVNETIKYFQKHPMIRHFPAHLSGLDIVESEYSSLSKAVHGSSATFRITDDGKAIALWKMDAKYLGIWATHEKRTILAINSLLLMLFREHLQGSKLSSLRQSIGLVLPSGKDAEIKSQLNVTIKR